MHNARYTPPRVGETLSQFEASFRLPKSSTEAAAMGFVAEPTLLNDSLYAINSTYIETIDQGQTEQVWPVLAWVIAMFFGVTCALFLLTHLNTLYWGVQGIDVDTGQPFPEWNHANKYAAMGIVVLLIGGSIVFGWLAKYLTPFVLFIYTRLPIRFNRSNRTVYAFKGNGPGEVWAVPWDADNVLFCIHPAKDVIVANLTVNTYDLRCIELDEAGKIYREFVIGKGYMAVEDIQRNWAYYLRYMEDGPRSLRLPHYFWSPHERQSYDEMTAVCKANVHDTYSPLALLDQLWSAVLSAPLLAFSLWTGKEPRWPQEVEDACRIDPDDPFARPFANQPVGLSYVASRPPGDWGWISSAKRYAPDKLPQWLPLYQPVEDDAKRRYPTDV